MADADSLRSELDDLRRRVYELSLRVDARATAEPGLELEPGSSLQVLVCVIGPQRFALPLEFVREVVPAARLTPLTEAPPWVSGLLNLGGEAIAVIDVLARVRRGARRVELSDQFVLCSDGDGLVGLTVQSVLGVETVRVPAAARTAEAADIPHAPYLDATLALGSELVGLLSIRRLVASSDIPALEEEEEQTA